MQLPHAVGEHGRVSGRPVELAIVDLGDVSQQLGGGGPIAGDQRGETMEQGIVRQMNQRVALHGKYLDGGEP
jgi:hypothetical protein